MHVLISPHEPGQKLTYIKCSNDPSKNPIVAFATAGLGQRWIAGWSRPDDFALAHVDSLSEPTLSTARGSPVLLFTTEQQIKAYFENQAEFTQKAELLSYAQAHNSANTHVP